MSKFEEFCTSYWVGKAKNAEERLNHEGEFSRLAANAGNIAQRMCAYFQCPADQVQYVDIATDTVCGTIRDSLPSVHFSPDKGRNRFVLEIKVTDRQSGGNYPIWLQFEFVPLKHGGFEFYFGSDSFQVPTEERRFFDHVADRINHELRQGDVPAPLRLGF